MVRFVMVKAVTLQEARASAEVLYRNGQLDEADLVAMAILRGNPRDFFGCKILGLIARDRKRFGLGVTWIRNALRVIQNDPELLEALEECRYAMQKRDYRKTLYIIGDSHTEPYRVINQAVVHWVGPVTMHRIARDGVSFLDYRFYGVFEGATVLTVFGEIDARMHMLRLWPNRIGDAVDALVSEYLKAVQKAFVASGAARQMVASVIPPHRCPPVEHGAFGGFEDRLSVVRAINDRLRFGCRIFGFDYLDQYTPFADDYGGLADKFTLDGLHLYCDCGLALAKEIKSIAYS